MEAVKLVEYHNLSADELKNRIAQIEQERAEAQRALNERSQAEKADLANEIRRMIEARGYDLEEIVSHVLPKRRRGGGKKGPGNYTRYVDPENPENVYSRGVLPRWMKDKMAALGLDSGDKDDRESFKTNHLRPLQD